MILLDKNIKLWLSVMLVTLLFLVLLFTLSHNPGHINALLVLSSILILSVSIRYLIFYENSKYFKYGQINIILDLIITFILCIYDTSTTSKILFFILIGDAIIFYSVKYCLFIIFLCYVFYIGSGYLLNGYSIQTDVLSYMFTFTLGIASILFAMFIIKYLSLQKQTLLSTMKKLENTNGKLAEANLELEQMVKIKERNRIAAEVHDTIGHTLTIVLMEIEAAKIYINKDSKEARKKLELAQEQARKGLNQIIRSIRDIKNDREEVGFEIDLLKFTDEIEHYSNITVITNITITEIISNEIGDALLKSIREGVTNGIRHGMATQFNLCVSIMNNTIDLTMIDNGKGCSEIKQDFGLNAICQRIEALKGMVEFASIEGENFTIEIKIPIWKG